MRVTNGDIWQANVAVGELCGMAWPVKVAYRLAKLARKIGQEHRDIDRVRVRLVERYGHATANGQFQVAPDSPSFAGFVADWNALIAEEIDVEIEPVALPLVDGMEIKPGTLLAMGPFIVMEDDGA